MSMFKYDIFPIIDISVGTWDDLFNLQIDTFPNYIIVFHKHLINFFSQESGVRSLFIYNNRKTSHQPMTEIQQLNRQLSDIMR